MRPSAAQRAVRSARPYQPGNLGGGGPVACWCLVHVHRRAAPRPGLPCPMKTEVDNIIISFIVDVVKIDDRCHTTHESRHYGSALLPQEPHPLRACDVHEEEKSHNTRRRLSRVSCSRDRLSAPTAVGLRVWRRSVPVWSAVGVAARRGPRPDAYSSRRRPRPRCTRPGPTRHSTAEHP